MISLSLYNHIVYGNIFERYVQFLATKVVVIESNQYGFNMAC